VLWAFLPMPYMALYSATKHAVEGYSESLDHELRTRGVRVICDRAWRTRRRRSTRTWSRPTPSSTTYRERARVALAVTLTRVMLDGG
jgi:short-subunit dehydrogenase